MVGTSIEWYDFFIFGTASALVFGRLFFPTFSELAGTLAAFASFAVGFVARPVGGLVFGHIGDRSGRKTTLVLTLTMMGLATFAMGLMPSYAVIGAWAPILMVVLRFVQGMAVGGEWGGAVLMATEHAGAERRGFFGSFAQMGSAVGGLMATGIFLLMQQLPEDDFVSWGWRVPVPLQHRAGVRWPVHPAADHGVAGLRTDQRGPPSREGASGWSCCDPNPATCCWPPECTWRTACCSTP
jgi:MFS family permease